MAAKKKAAKKPAYSKAVEAALADLVIANRILANEGVIDAFGHCSIRHPERDDRYFLARSRSPELVERGDILEFDLDSNPINPDGRTMYSERPIHGCIYKVRPEVKAVCHNHAHSLIPFGVTGSEIKPIWHVAGGIGAEVPVWDIREDFGDTDLLVTNNDLGGSLARKLGKNRCALMRGHGAVVVPRAGRNPTLDEPQLIILQAPQVRVRDVRVVRHVLDEADEEAALLVEGHNGLACRPAEDGGPCVVG